MPIIHKTYCFLCISPLGGRGNTCITFIEVPHKDLRPQQAGVVYRRLPAADTGSGHVIFIGKERRIWPRRKSTPIFPIGNANTFHVIRELIRKISTVCSATARSTCWAPSAEAALSSGLTGVRTAANACIPTGGRAMKRSSAGTARSPKRCPPNKD